MIAQLFADAPRLDRVLFRVDADKVPGLSFGHLERCAILSRRLRNRHGSETIFLMRPLKEGVMRARNLGQLVAPPEQWSGLLAKADVVVVDVPFDPEPEVIEAAGKADAYLAVLDDTGRDLCACNVVLNSSVLARPEMYPRAARKLLGPDHLILDDHFRKARHLGSRDHGSPTVLLTFGGSDPTGLTLRVLKALKGALLPCRLIVVVGPGFGEPSAVEEISSSLEVSCRVVRSPSDLLPFFIGCDLAVCAGGRTMYELYALGVPTLAVASAPHENVEVSSFLKRGMLKGGVREWNERRFREEFERTLRTINDKPSKEI